MGEFGTFSLYMHQASKGGDNRIPNEKYSLIKQMSA